MREIIVDASKELEDIYKLSGYDNKTRFDKINERFTKDLIDPKKYSEYRSFLNVDTLKHINYLTYLETCWKTHYGLIVKPDFLWFIIISEIASIIKDSPEDYRANFSESKAKLSLTIAHSDPSVLNIDSLFEKLSEVLPNKDIISDFIPEFSTSNASDTFAFKSVLCDAMQVYYEYFTYCCGISKMKIFGTKDDYNVMSYKLDHLLSNGLDKPKMRSYIEQVKEQLKTIYDNFDNDEFWSGMFWLEFCGSGSQTEVRGWIRNFYIKNINPSYVSNYSKSVSVVPYKNLADGKYYTLMCGLFESNISQDGYLNPEFNYLICNDNEVRLTDGEKKAEANSITLNLITRKI